MQPPGWSHNADDDRMVHHPVHGGDGDDRVAKVIAEFSEVDIGGNDGGTLAVAAINHFVKQAGVFGVMLFETVEADLIDEQDFRGKKELELLVEGVVGQAGQEFSQHGRGGDIAAPIVLLAADEKQGLGEVTLAVM